jgi:hypothetical protein
VAKKNAGLKVLMNEIEKAAPPVDPIEALRRNALYAMYEELDPDDMKVATRAQIDKARGGDNDSYRILVSLLKQSGGEKRPVNMQQAFVFGQGGNGVAFISDIRRGIAALLSLEAPLPGPTIAEKVHLLLPQVLEAVAEHDWFQQTKNGWKLTRKGVREALADGGVK